MLQQKSNGVTLPKVGIVTLNWNGLKHLKYFLPTVSNQTYNNFFTIVVDNGSNDDSIKFINRHYPRVEVMDLKNNYGYSKGFNKGINLAIEKGAEYVLITNNDVVLDSNILKEGVSLFKSDKKIGFMSGKIYELSTDKRFQYAGGRVNFSTLNMPSRGAGELDIGQYEEIKDFEFMDDVCCLVSTNMIKKIGMYDEDFFFDYEETEWNYRMRMGGFRIVYNPKMRAWHRIHGSTKGSRYSRIPEFYHYRGKILFNYKVHSSNYFLFFMILFLFKEMPLHWLVLIKRQKTFLIYHNFSGILSALKRLLV